MQVTRLAGFNMMKRGLRTAATASRQASSSNASNASVNSMIPSKDEIVVITNEYSKSGCDSDAARIEDSAFGISSSNSPQGQKMQAQEESAAKGLDTNPLETSPANEQLQAEQMSASMQWETHKTEGDRVKRSQYGITMKKGSMKAFATKDAK